METAGSPCVEKIQEAEQLPAGNRKRRLSRGNSSITGDGGMDYNAVLRDNQDLLPNTDCNDTRVGTGIF